MDIQQLMDTANSWPSRIILSAVELGVFSALREPKSGDEVAAECETSPDATRRLLNALAAMDILELNSGKYSIVPQLKEGLGDGPDSIIHSLHHRVVLWTVWNDLTNIIKTGKSYDEPVGSRPHTVERQHAFSRAMSVVGRGIAEITADAIDFSNVDRMLDIGGAPGVYAREFLKVAPQMRVSILDRPGAQDIVKEITGEYPEYERIDFIEGDALEVDDSTVTADGEFDMVFMSNLIHSMSPGEIKDLFSRCCRWVKPRGRILVKDFLLDDTRTKPARGAIFSLNMLVATPGGNSYTWTEVENWFREIRTTGGDPAVSSTSRIEIGNGDNGIVAAFIN
jgi:predicted O-methyltransferase YrrM